MYCEKCCRIFEDDRCPHCKRSKVRPPEQNDPCFLTEENYVTSTILEDLLKQNNIPFLKKDVMGAGMAIKVGPMLERSRFYVPFNVFEKAGCIAEALNNDSQEIHPDEQICE